MELRKLSRPKLDIVNDWEVRNAVRVISWEMECLEGCRCMKCFHKYLDKVVQMSDLDRPKEECVIERFVD